MVETRPSITVEQALAALEELPSVGVIDATVSALGWLSSDRIAGMFGGVGQTLRARFSGALPAAHAIGVRSATAVLGELQESLSEIAASSLNVTPARGPLPSNVLSATELQLTPAVEAGSVIFSMHPPLADGLWDLRMKTLLDSSLESLFGLLSAVEHPKESDESLNDVSDALRVLGPRAAHRIFKFAGALGDANLDLDLGWMDGVGARRNASLSSGGAKFLRELAKEATSQQRDVLLKGNVYRIGKDNRHQFEDDDLGRVKISSTGEVTDSLVESFKGGRVSVECVVTETVNLTTGVVSRKYEALRVGPLD